jgi:hypothetical protein
MVLNELKKMKMLFPENQLLYMQDLMVFIIRMIWLLLSNMPWGEHYLLLESMFYLLYDIEDGNHHNMIII